MMRAWIRGAVLTLTGLTTACYTGFAADDAEGGLSGGGQTGGSASGGGGGDGQPDPDDPATLCMDEDIGDTPLRRLTATQYDHTVRDLLGLDGGYTADFAPDERSGAFKSNASAAVVELQVEQYMTAAEAVAVDAVADLEALLPCDIAEGDVCAQTFLADFAQRAYRRPLSTDENARVMAVYETGKAEANGDVVNGLRIAIGAVLQSPFFLYHVEFGLSAEDIGADEMVELDGYELASRLSYFLWDSMPDDALFDAAASGELSSADGVRAQVDRMLTSPKAQDTIAAFHQQWLGVDELEHAEKNPEMFPQYDSTLAASMKDDVASFAQWVMTDGDGKLETLLTANVTLSEDPRLLSLYGVSVPVGHVSGEPITLPAGERAGLITMAGVMAEHAHPEQTSPIHRGVMLRQNFFCQQLPPPPPDVDNVPPSPDPNATTRERFAQHTSDAACASCHALIDPLGFGLEGYDAVGAFRTEEGNGLPIDDAGEVTSADVNGPFTGGVELAQILATSEIVQECTSRQWFRYALGRVETTADECALDSISEAFAESEYDVRALLREITLSSAFRFRKAAS